MSMNRLLIEKSKKNNLVITTSPQSESLYIRHCGLVSANIMFFPLGFEPNLYRPISHLTPEDVAKYSCDISFYCDNLYSGHKDQYIPRKILITELISASKRYNWTFHLYGSPKVGLRYPDCYKGDPNYLHLPMIYNLSKINLVTHLTTSKTIFADHLFSVLACGGLVMTDSVDQFNRYLSIDGHLGVIYLHKEHFIAQIKTIIDMNPLSQTLLEMKHDPD